MIDSKNPLKTNILNKPKQLGKLLFPNSELHQVLFLRLYIPDATKNTSEMIIQSYFDSLVRNALLGVKIDDYNIWDILRAEFFSILFDRIREINSGNYPAEVDGLKDSINTLIHSFILIKPTTITKGKVNSDFETNGEEYNSHGNNIMHASNAISSIINCDNPEEAARLKEALLNSAISTSPDENLEVDFVFSKGNLIDLLQGIILDLCYMNLPVYTRNVYTISLVKGIEILGGSVLQILKDVDMNNIAVIRAFNTSKKYQFNIDPYEFLETMITNTLETLQDNVLPEYADIQTYVTLSDEIPGPTTNRPIIGIAILKIIAKLNEMNIQPVEIPDNHRANFNRLSIRPAYKANDVLEAIRSLKVENINQ